jgi:hypothetical protein
MRKELSAPLLAGAAAILAVLIAPAAANASEIGAGSGHAYGSANNACFDTTWGWVENTSCSTTNWQMSLPVTTTGAFNPTISFYDSGTTTFLTCGTYAVDKTGQTISWTGMITRSGFFGVSRNGAFQPGAETVPAGGYLGVSCNMPEYTYVYSVTW